MYQRFLWNAARNALAAGDITIYDRAYRLAAANLNGEQSVRNLGVPSPKMLARLLGQPLVWSLDIAAVCTGLWIAEWALEHPEQAAGITWDYWPELSQRIAQQVILEG